MQNTDIIILTSVLVVLFLVFIIATVREFGEMNNKEYDGSYKPGGPPTDFVRLVGKLFSEENVNVKKRIILIDAVKEALKDLEIEEIEKQGKEDVK